MFVANPSDPALSPIRLVAGPGPSSTLSASTRARSAGHSHASILVVAALVGAVGGFAVGYAANSASVDSAGGGRTIDLAARPGEFRLAPGLDQPPGIVEAPR